MRTIAQIFWLSQKSWTLKFYSLRSAIHADLESKWVPLKTIMIFYCPADFMIWTLQSLAFQKLKIRNCIYGFEHNSCQRKMWSYKKLRYAVTPCEYNKNDYYRSVNFEKNCQAEDSSKKRTNEFVFLVCDVFSFIFLKNPQPEKNVSRLSDL